jgi:hypothetical protein
MGKMRIIYFVFIIVSIPSLAQDWRTKVQFNVGCNWTLNYGIGQRFAGMRLSGGASVNGIYRGYIMANYGLSFSAYTKTIGANLNPLFADVQLDMVNGFSLGGCWGDSLSDKHLRTLNNGPFYNLVLDKQNAILVTSQLILNNHKRNQLVGAFTASLKSFSVNYTNDGGPIINHLALGDEFDRWWTGGLGIFIHPTDFNRVELSFDQFTGYSPLLYELTTILGVNVPGYNVKTDSARRDHNAAAYNVRFFPVRGFGIDFGVVGSLQTDRGVLFGLQDIIHRKTNVALHPNTDSNRIYWGTTFNSLRDENY